MPALHQEQLALLTYTPGSLGEITIRDLNALQPLFRSQEVYGVYYPLTTQTGAMAYGDRLLDWNTGSVKPLSAHAYSYANNGRWIVSRRCDTSELRSQSRPTWHMAVPFLRQWCRSNDGGQAVAFDIASGAEVASSPNFERDAFLSFHASDDGKTIVGATFNSNFYVWHVSKDSAGSDNVKHAP
jgi:hypothetical protein